MTRVDFYHDADDKLGVAARLAQKGHAAGKRLLVSAPDADLASQFDRLLWTFAPQSFVAHATDGSPLAAESPVVITRRIAADAAAAFDILINLDTALPGTIAGFERIIEIVGRDDADKAAARERYKTYRGLGCELVAHRLGQAE